MGVPAEKAVGLFATSPRKVPLSLHFTVGFSLQSPTQTQLIRKYSSLDSTTFKKFSKSICQLFGTRFYIPLKKDFLRINQINV
jgi:hypothetical protein